MPWKENKTMDLRVQLTRDYDEGETIAALSEIYSVARKTIYKWLARQEAEGAAGLADRSRAPHHSPQRLTEETIAHIIAARQRWQWGPRKLRIKLAAAHPHMLWPAESTIGEVLKRAGLTHRRKPRVRTPPYGQPFASVDAANQTWCADFKGWFRTSDGTRCDPLTLTDAHSRYLLRCHIVAQTDTTHVAAIFDAAFREYGLPRVIHTDNGTPFASRAPGGLSRVSMQWVKLGIVPERSRLASPQDNGRHERMHSTLKQATLQPPARDPRRQQEAFDRFQHEFNHERPHEALDDRTPASCYTASSRSMPRRVPELEYGDDVELRRVSQQGSLKMNGERTFISEIFAYEWLGLRALDERYFEVRYGPVRLGFLDTHEHTFHRVLGVALRRRLGIDPRPEPVEMPAGGKPGNPNAGFPPFPPSLEIAEAIPTFPQARPLLL
jgi:putative transposase